MATMNFKVNMNIIKFKKMSKTHLLKKGSYAQKIDHKIPHFGSKLKSHNKMTDFYFLLHSYQ